MADTEQAIARAQLTGIQATEDEVKSLIDLRQFLSQEVRKAKEAIDEAILGWVQANGEVYHNGTRYRPGHLTDTKRTGDVRDIAEAIISETAGDFDSFCEALSANAFKPGHTKKILGTEKFKKYYEQKKKWKLVKAKPRKGQDIEFDENKTDLKFELERSLVEWKDRKFRR